MKQRIVQTHSWTGPKIGRSGVMHGKKDMKAIVRMINPRRGMCAAEIEGIGEFVIFELLDSSEPEVGNVLSHHDFYSMGGETFKNLTQHCDIDVFVENVCGANLVRQQLLF